MHWGKKKRVGYTVNKHQLLLLLSHSLVHQTATKAAHVVALRHSLYWMLNHTRITTLIGMPKKRLSISEFTTSEWKPYINIGATKL